MKSFFISIILCTITFSTFSQFTQYSKPVGRSYPRNVYINTYPPNDGLRQETIMEGYKTRYERGESNYNKIFEVVEGLKSISSYGRDQEVIVKKVNAYITELNKFLKGIDLSNQNHANQAYQYILTAYEDGDISSIIRKVNFYHQCLDRKRQVENNGGYFNCPSFYNLENYYKGSVYLRDIKGVDFLPCY